MTATTATWNGIARGEDMVRRIITYWQRAAQSGPIMLSFYLGIGTIIRGLLLLVPRSQMGNVTPLLEMLETIGPAVMWATICTLIGLLQMVAALNGSKAWCWRFSVPAAAMWAWLVLLSLLAGGASTSFWTFFWIGLGEFFLWATLTVEGQGRIP